MEYYLNLIVFLALIGLAFYAFVLKHKAQMLEIELKQKCGECEMLEQRMAFQQERHMFDWENSGDESSSDPTIKIEQNAKVVVNEDAEPKED